MSCAYCDGEVTGDGASGRFCRACGSVNGNGPRLDHVALLAVHELRRIAAALEPLAHDVSERNRIARAGGRGWPEPMAHDVSERTRIARAGVRGWPSR